MKYIRKGHPPPSLVEYAREAGATYEGYKDKDEWSELMLQEQGWLCAYTLNRALPTTR